MWGPSQSPKEGFAYKRGHMASHGLLKIQHLQRISRLAFFRLYDSDDEQCSKISTGPRRKYMKVAKRPATQWNQPVSGHALCIVQVQTNLCSVRPRYGPQPESLIPAPWTYTLHCAYPLTSDLQPQSPLGEPRPLPSPKLLEEIQVSAGHPLAL